MIARLYIGQHSGKNRGGTAVKDQAVFRTVKRSQFPPQDIDCGV